MAEKPILADEDFITRPFPVGGLDTSRGYSDQQPGTAPVATNVRGFEVLTERDRGGSRPGLAKWIPGRIPGGASVIQHLSYVVDPQAQALVGDFNPFTYTPFYWSQMDDPSTNNVLYPDGFGRNPAPVRQIRVGGSGAQPNRKKNQPMPAQQVVENTDPTSSFSFSSQVSTGDLIVVIFGSSGSNTPDTSEQVSVTGVTDSLGNTYTQVESNLFFGPFSATDRPVAGLSLWYAISGASGTCSISDTVSPVTSSPSRAVVALTYKNIQSASPLQDHNQATFSKVWAGPPTPTTMPMSVGPVSASGGNSLVIAAFYVAIDFAPQGSFTVRTNSSVDQTLCVVQATNVTGSITASGTGSAGTLVNDDHPEVDHQGYVAIIASFLGGAVTPANPPKSAPAQSARRFGNLGGF